MLVLLYTKISLPKANYTTNIDRKITTEGQNRRKNQVTTRDYCTTVIDHQMTNTTQKYTTIKPHHNTMKMGKNLQDVSDS